MNTLNKLMNSYDVNQLIKSNRLLVLAAHHSLLKNLEKGNWIAGTIPYFMDETGGCFSKDKIFVTDLTDLAAKHKIKVYDKTNLDTITEDTYSNGFSYILIPGLSEIHSKYAIKVDSFAGLYNNPVYGWVTGIDLNDTDKITPKIVDGRTLLEENNKLIILHIKMFPNKLANLEILNIFSQGSGDAIRFKNEGFVCKECIINGEEQNLSEYIEKNKIDTRLPLVADYSGAMINISFQKIDTDKKLVYFYAPLRTNTMYKLANPVKNYVTSFNEIIPEKSIKVIASCNCILNYLYSGLEGKKTGVMKGPFTFGEIAYVIVNQTLVYISIVNK